MECKLKTYDPNDEFDEGINRNIVECKEYSWTKIKGDPGVLIETLWNVKLINWIIANVVPVY